MQFILCHVAGEKVKLAWERLTDSYYQARTRLRKKVEKSGAGASDEPKWYLWHQMKWTDDYAKKRR